MLLGAEKGCLKARGLAQAHVISLVLGFVWKDADTNHFPCKLTTALGRRKAKVESAQGFTKYPLLYKISERLDRLTRKIVLILVFIRKHLPRQPTE